MLFGRKLQILCLTLFTAAAFQSVEANAQIAAPTDIGGLVLWVDAQDVNGNGSQPANGANVSTWVDKSGSGNNLNTVAGTVTYEATGFDGINPGLRFPFVARMTGPNPFGGFRQNQMTLFFVNANVSITRNFVVSLNGTNTGANIANGRFSFHTPWVDNRLYFDAGACCGTTRLQGVNPNGLTDTAVYSAVNDEPGNRQLFRVDGAPFASDTTGHNAVVSQGIHIGDLPVGGISYNGRFAEFLIYNRALSLAEIQDVECYLVSKWKQASAPAGCNPNLSVSKSSTPWDTSGLGEFFIPGNDTRYEVTATKTAGAGISNNSLVLVDSLPNGVIFYNGDVDDGGPESDPVGFSQTGAGLTFNYATDVAFSDAATAPSNFAACAYTPTPGYDANVRHICINPKGALLGSSTPTSFTVFFRAQVP